jgi:hypothetical protein
MSAAQTLVIEVGENSSLWRRIAKIAAGQQGNITTARLLGLGMRKDALYYAVRTGRLFRVFHGVYAVGRPPVKAIERAAAAVLACGPRAALSHASAMTLWGFWKHWDEPFDVTAAVDRRRQGIRTHRCTTLLTRDVTLHHGIRVTTPARTVLDIAPRLKPKALTRLINDARRTPLLTLEDLADVVERNPLHPGAQLIRPHLDNPQNPTRSGGEDDFPAFCERYDLPIPLINAIVHGFEVDAYFPEERVIVELDGWPYHRDRSSFESDRDRDATMLAYGIPTVRITYDRFEQDPDREAARLHAILEWRRAT